MTQQFCFMLGFEVIWSLLQNNHRLGNKSIEKMKIPKEKQRRGLKTTRSFVNQWRKIRPVKFNEE